jgi:hypothetical protein
MLYACVEKFDVMGVRGNILGWDREVNTPLVWKPETRKASPRLDNSDRIKGMWQR